MTQLIDESDPRYFKVTCDKPYDRHSYRLHLTDGRSVDFDDYEKLHATWFQTANMFLGTVEVLDIKSKPKGF
tara:strand:- start:334 stop:549 length:216 start_codon:yes stop_codon:yes gene_type:complete